MSDASTTVEELRQIIRQFVDERDWRQFHAPKNVAMAQFDPEHKDLGKVKDKPVAVICRSGQTSAGAASRLVKAGFKRVYTLAGGTAAWTAADLPLHKGRK